MALTAGLGGGGIAGAWPAGVPCAGGFCPDVWKILNLVCETVTGDPCPPAPDPMSSQK